MKSCPTDKTKRFEVLSHNGRNKVASVSSERPKRRTKKRGPENGAALESIRPFVAVVV
jgi:hypothetical protein